jgi:hypothetical protein
MNKKNDKFINFKTNHLKEESKNFEVKPISDTINEENLLKFNNFGLVNRSESNNNLNNKYISKNSNNLTGSTNNPNSASGTVNYSKIESESSRTSNYKFRELREGFSFGRLQYLHKNPQRDGIINSNVKIGGASTRTKKSEISEFIYENKPIIKDKFNYNKKVNIPPRAISSEKKISKKLFKFDYNKKFNKYGFKY